MGDVLQDAVANLKWMHDVLHIVVINFKCVIFCRMPQ